MKFPVILRWVEADLIHPTAKHASKHYFSRASIDEFRKNFMYTEKAAELLGIATLTLQKWVRNGRIQAVSGLGIDERHRYLFDKRELLKWRAAQYITAPKLAKQLGVSYSQLLLWVKKGQLVPVSGPGIDKCGHYLFMPQELLEDKLDK